MVLLRIERLPADPLAAASMFYSEWLERARALLNPPRNGEVAARSADGGDSPNARRRQVASPLHHPADGPPPRFGEDLLIVFPPADHTHRAWRLAAMQGLAREAVPQRINAVASDDPAAIASAQAYLAAAPGLTGQYLPLDGAGAGAVIESAA